MLMQPTAKIMRREASASGPIPYSAHVGTHVVRTKSGDYVQSFRLSGASFESADDENLNTWHEKLNILWRNIASPNLAVWVHVLRRRDSAYPAGAFRPGFAADLDARYRQKIAGETLMVNELYVSLVYRPQPTAVGAATLRVIKTSDLAQGAAELRDSLDECDKKQQELLASLARYDPEPLGIYSRDGVRYSTLLEFFGTLINGEWNSIPVPRSPIDEVLNTSRLMFGVEAMEYRTPTQTRLAAFLGIKEYPTPTLPGMFNALLTAPFPFVLTQSFAFLPKATAIDMMTRQQARMLASGDLAESQIAEISQALDDLTSNRFVVGDHHFTLQVQADAFDGIQEAEGSGRLKKLNDHIAGARFLLAETSMVVAREDLAMEAGFWAQLPGNFAYRPRKCPITSRNFSAMAPFHNYPSGRPGGNHWGPALTLFVTHAHSPYFFSLHASDPNRADGGSRKDVGHQFICGPVGTGKTVMIGFLVANLEKFGTTQVIFDKDEGLHILVRALGGKYRSLKSGVPTGCNPLQLDSEVAANVEFMKAWLRVIVRRGDEAFTVRQDEDLDQALHGVLALKDVTARRLSRLVEFLDSTDPEGMYARLRKWTDKLGGDYAWVFDSGEDDIARFMETSPLIGFDVTDFLNNSTVSEPLTLYLLHLTSRLVDGRRLVCWMDEFAKLINREAFANFSKNGLETWRKLEASFCAATQSTSHVLESDIARAIIEQTPTKIFFPNPDADYAEYTEGFSLTDHEFGLIKHDLEPGTGTFLIKQGHVSVVARLNLKGFDFELDVISGRARNVQLMKRLIAEHGDAPALWLPKFREACAAERAAAQGLSMQTKEKSHVLA
jgi:type IV secretion system protein VirB4